MFNYSAFALVLIASLCFYNTSKKDYKFVHNKPLQELRNEYDFIIIGGGSAGSVVASRLSEIGSWNVLLIEAGGEETLEVDTPLLADELIQSSLDWNFTTVPQKNMCLENDGICTEPFGKVLGGSGSLNGMFHLRGVPSDFDRWEEIGNKGWSWKDVFPYFKLSENNTNPEYKLDTINHNTQGLLTIGPNPYETELANAYIKAGEHLGYRNVDLSGNERIGFMKFNGATRNGRRCTSNKAFLRPASDRKNLHVTLETIALQLVFKNKEIQGVLIEKNGKRQIIKVKKEIIVSAGAVNTPKLLLLSGIGPKEHLESIGIKNIADLPVGENLQNHVAMYTFYTVNGGAVTEKEYMSNEAIIMLAINNTGPLTLCYGHEATALMNSTKFHTKDIPDFQILFASYKHPGNISAIRSGGYQLRPKSRGNIRLKSKDYYEQPLIDPKYLDHPDDLEAAIEIFKATLDINKTPALAKYEPKLINENCKDLKDRLFDECMVKKNAISGSHHVASCRMSPDGVVDNQLKIYGIKNVRIADASVMPFIVSSNINGAIIMIAERISDFIKKEYRQNTLL